MRTIVSLVLCAAQGVIFVPYAARAEDGCCPEVAGALVAAQDEEQAFRALEKAQDCFFARNAYSEACACVASAAQKNKHAAASGAYFCALSAYRRMKYLEEQQLWDEYFSRGNEYRDQISSNIAAVFKEARPPDGVFLAARLLDYRFHKDMEDALVEEALAALVQTATEYAGGPRDPGLLKEAAETLQSYDERGKSKELFRLYIAKAMAGVREPEELNAMAQGFLKDRNLELAQTVYDVLIERLTGSADKDVAGRGLLEIARAFAYKDDGVKDPAYAEKAFGVIESLGGRAALDEESVFLRGYNLEKAGEFERARDVYADLVRRFPQSSRVEAVLYRLGLIDAYALRDRESARQYFAAASSQKAVTTSGIASLYQLGLLAQWEDDPKAATVFYNRVLEAAAAGGYPETLEKVRRRMQEIETGALLDASLREMLDCALRPEFAMFDRSRARIDPERGRVARNAQLSVGSNALAPQSGCMQVSLEYAWAGDLGTASPAVDATAFTTAYAEQGTKVISMIVKSPGGIVDRAVVFIDVE